MTLKEYLKSKREKINKDLKKCLPPVESEAAKLWESMEYTLNSEGKRIRPVLMYAVYESLQRKNTASSNNLCATACAIEMVHASSLMLDDFPSMDNSSLRRGKSVNHIVYGEAVALLAADALLTYAFELLAREVKGEVGLQLIRYLSKAVGTQGMIGGQVVDLQSRGKKIDYETLMFIHRHKTSALFEYAARAGALLAEATPEETETIVNYASNVGLAYQITDDIQDFQEGPSIAQIHQEVNFASILGMEKARQQVKELIESASGQLDKLSLQSKILRQMAEYVGNRID